MQVRAKSHMGLFPELLLLGISQRQGPSCNGLLPFPRVTQGSLYRHALVKLQRCEFCQAEQSPHMRPYAQVESSIGPLASISCSCWQTGRNL